MAARLVSDTGKFDHGLTEAACACRPSLARCAGTSEIQAHVDGALHNCLHHKAPWYLMDYCVPISDVASRRHLRSARRHYLVVP